MLSILLHVNILDIRAVWHFSWEKFQFGKTRPSLLLVRTASFHSKNINNIKITILDIHIHPKKKEKKEGEKSSVHCTIIFFYVI